MTRRATTQAIAASERTEGDSDAVRIRHQLDAWANASNRTPRLVATPAEDVGVESSGEAPLPATKRSRAPSIHSHQGGQEHQGQVSQGEGRRGQDRRCQGTEADGEPQAPDALLEPLPVSAAPAVPVAVPATPERARTSRAFALVAALGAGDGCCLFFGRGHGRDISR